MRSHLVRINELYSVQTRFLRVLASLESSGNKNYSCSFSKNELFISKVLRVRVLTAIFNHHLSIDAQKRLNLLNLQSGN